MKNFLPKNQLEKERIDNKKVIDLVVLREWNIVGSFYVNFASICVAFVSTQKYTSWKILSNQAKCEAEMMRKCKNSQNIVQRSSIERALDKCRKLRAISYWRKLMGNNQTSHLV